MNRFHIGSRIIKTGIATMISLLIFIVLLLIDRAMGYKIETFDFKERFELLTPSNYYTPFFAGIAACFAIDSSPKDSFKRARIRSMGTIIGGCSGALFILLIDFFLVDIFSLSTSNFVLYKAIVFVLVSLLLIPVMKIAVLFKQSDAVFITSLTYLSVTISVRNGGQAVIPFAFNRILSTIVGVMIALVINNCSSWRHKNKNIMFVSGLDNSFLQEKENISPYIKYELNNLYDNDMNLIFATTRTFSSLEYIFRGVRVNRPMVTMNGSAVYEFSTGQYSNKLYMSNEVRIGLENLFQKYSFEVFTYSIYDNCMYAYYDKISKYGTVHYFKNRRENNVFSFVKGRLPEDELVSLFVVVDKKENILKFAKETENASFKDSIDVIYYPFHENDEEYYYLKINSRLARKENSIDYLQKRMNTDLLIVCGTGKTDIPLMKKSDLAFCLKDASKEVKENANFILDSNEPKKVLLAFEKIYYSRNPKKYIHKHYLSLPKSEINL